MNRVIGAYIGEQEGPLFIAIAGMHGNEKAGIQAIETLLGMLEQEKQHNPDFIFSGQFVGLKGNLQALQQNERYIEKDLNRQFIPDNIKRIRHTPYRNLMNEELELKEFLDEIDQLINQYKPQKLVVLDLHTTSSDGGIFSVVTDELRSLQIAVQLHAPVITGMLNGLNGTTLHYFSNLDLPLEVVAVAFEAGQHEDPISVDRSISAMVNCMKSIGSVPRNVVESKHDDLLKNYARNLPKVVEFCYVHHIAPDDDFQMQPNYYNFQPVRKGDLLAKDKHGNILAKEDGLIVMPLYQSRGEDGFFIVKEQMSVTF